MVLAMKMQNGNLWNSMAWVLKLRHAFSFFVFEEIHSLLIHMWYVLCLTVLTGKFRITKALGWVPKTANREQAFAHLDARVPEDLKYSLHTLIITHGRSCNKCAARGMPGNRKVDDLEGGCPLKKLMKMNPNDIED